MVINIRKCKAYGGPAACKSANCPEKVDRAEAFNSATQVLNNPTSSFSEKLEARETIEYLDAQTKPPVREKTILDELPAGFVSMPPEDRPGYVLCENEYTEEWEAKLDLPVSYADRIRMLLDVDDPNAPVTDEVAGGIEGSEWTPESWNTVTIQAGDVKKVFEGDDALPRLLKHIEHADKGSSRVTVLRMLGHMKPALKDEMVNFHFDNGAILKANPHHISGSVSQKRGGQVDVTDANGRERRFDLERVTHITPIKE